MSTPSIAERVAAGVEWLDANVPGWWKPERIDLDRLSLSSCVNCVLGQLFGDFFDAPSEVIGTLVSAEFGFDRRSDEWNTPAYPDLTAEWVRVIQERRQAAGEAS